ncbi:MAG: PRD domain-containing protein [Lachnospiraceae bacterium]|nr:PRD domain-containing protein [Lachnospiraceae bacterium]MCI9251009.1 PRD domain-containing protein [Lachnospiraceae bacterium]
MLRGNLRDLLDILPEEHYITIEMVSKQMKLSKRTISTRIGELNALLRNNGAFIESKPRYGIRLCIVDIDRFTAFQQNKKRNADFIPDNTNERVEFLVVYLLNQENYVKSDDLCDLLCVSRGTLSAAIKRVEIWFSNYNVSLERRPNYGIRIVGEEQDFRNCLVKVMLKTDLFRSMTDITWMGEVRELTAEVLQYLPEHMINLSETAIENFVMYLYVSLKRMKRGKTVNVIIQDMPQIYNHEWRYVDKLISIFEEKTEVTYTESERQYLALQLAGTRMIGNAEQDEVNVVIKSDIEQSVIQMLELINIHFGYDFRNSLDIRMQLCQHMVSFDIRMCFGIPLKNPSLQEVKKQCMLGYQMASVAATSLAVKYGKEIPEDEIGFFAIIFAYAAHKYKSKIEKKNILVVCGSGKSSSRLLKFQYQQTFGDYLENIYVCDMLELNTFDFNKVDYVFTTVPIEGYIPIPVMQVNMFLIDNDKKRVAHVLEIGKNDFLRKYFQRDLFCTEIKGTDREMIVQELCEKVMQQYNLPENFTDLVLQREKLGATDYGNFVAIPHPLKAVTKTSFVYTAILDKPIYWWQHDVQVIFLIVVGEEEDPDIQKFYEMTTRFISDNETVKKLIQYKDYDRMMGLFDELCTS